MIFPSADFSRFQKLKQCNKNTNVAYLFFDKYQIEPKAYGIIIYKTDKSKLSAKMA